MKRITIFTTLLLLLVSYPSAHSECSINMAVIPLEYSDSPAIAAQSALDTKLKRLLTANSISVESEHMTPFFITGEFNDSYQQTLAGPPRKTALQTTLTLYCGNHLAKTIYSSMSIELRGIGDNPTDAAKNAIVSLKPTDKQFQDFIENSKSKIIGYYNNNLSSIIQQAKKAASLHDYPKAICLLISIPSCCSGYDSISTLIDNYYSNYIDLEGERLLQQARGIWAVAHSLENATTSIELLTQIDPESSVYTKATELISEIDSAMESNRNYIKHELTDKIIDLEKHRLNVISDIIQARYQSANNPHNVSITWIK